MGGWQCTSPLPKKPPSDRCSRASISVTGDRMKAGCFGAPTPWPGIGEIQSSPVVGPPGSPDYGKSGVAISVTRRALAKLHAGSRTRF